MVAFEDAEGFAEEVGLVEAIGRFGFYAVLRYLLGRDGRSEGGLTHGDQKQRVWIEQCCPCRQLG